MKPIDSPSDAVSASAAKRIALAERCEAAAGPDRELDAEILRLTGGPEIRWIGDGDGVFRGKCYTVWSERNPLPRSVPAYTASLDAAMTLKPEGMRLMLSEWDDETHLRPRGPWQAVLSLPGADASFDLMRGHRCDHANSPALALCAAALRARASGKPA